MQCTRSTVASNILTKQSASSLLKSFNVSIASKGSRPALLLVQQQHISPRRQFSTTHQHQFSKGSHLLMKEFFPIQESEHIKRTPPAWSHPVYTEEQMNAVVVAHREAKNWSDRVALTAVRILRWGLDLATGYKHSHAVKLNRDNPNAAQQKYGMTERKYMIRNIFLESVAGEQTPPQR
jgi:ubiquinol oxidase